MAAQWKESSYEAPAEVTGEVLQVDVRERQFQLWRKDGTEVAVSFTEGQEDLVTTALKGHRSVQVSVQGQGEYSENGQLLRFTRVDSLQMSQPNRTEFDPAAPAIEDVLTEIASEIPKEEWDRLPADLTNDLDHYLYGTPKKQ